MTEAQRIEMPMPIFKKSGDRPFKRAANMMAGTSAGIAAKCRVGSMSPSSKTISLPTPVPEPVVFLRRLFGSTNEGRILLECDEKTRTFQKPSSASLAAYGTDLVDAVRSKNIDKLQEYLENGRTLNACNKFGESILHLACRRGHLDVVRFLVGDAKVDVGVYDDFGRTPVHDAVWTTTPNLEILEILLNVAPPRLLLAEDVRGNTPFHYARREHYAQWNRFLRDHRQVILKKLAATRS